MNVFSTEIYRQVGGRDLSMRCYWPEGAPAFGLVAFHGGGWVEGSPAMWHALALELRARRVAVFLPEYRLLGSAAPDLTLDDLIADAHAACRWAEKRLRAAGLPGERIGAGGGSAGGHLALSIAMLPPPPPEPAAERPGFLLLCNPVADCSPSGFGTHILGENWPTYSPLHRMDSARRRA